jgi:signal peptidase I
MAIFRKKIGKQGTWTSALLLFFGPLLILFSIRWLLFEPFVIPSGSMEPTLQIHDHIFVKKFSYGVRMPFGDGWLFNYSRPKRGDVIVFRYPENKKVFFIKRVIGIPGDRLVIRGGEVSVNGNSWVYVPALADEIDEANKDFRYFVENTSNDEFHYVKFNSSGVRVNPKDESFDVPAHSYFVMGDNRDQSRDSRFWGFVDHSLVIGQASFVWLSCEKTLETAPMICDPATLRTFRMFKGVQ